MDKQPNILLVDDEERILNFIKIKLKASGYGVATANNGQEGLSLVESQKPDLILLDILMPIMDGFEMLKRLRAFSTVPVIVISAHTSTMGKALELGANDCIMKPFSPDELLNRIRNLLNHKK